MRLLYIPNVTRQSLVDNVGFQEFLKISEATHRLGLDVYWYVVVPSWATDGMRGHQRLQYLYMDSTRDGAVSELVGFSADEIAKFFSRRGGRYIVDAIISNKAGFASYVASLLGDPFGHATIPVIIRDNGDTIKKLSSNNDRDLFFMLSNYVNCYTALRSNSEMSIVSSIVGKNLSPSIARTFVNRSFVWNSSFDQVDRCDRSDDSLVVFSGGDFRNSANRRRELLLYRRLFATHGVKVVVYTGSSRSRIKQAFPDGDESFISSINPNVQMGAYTSHLSMADMFVSFSSKFDTVDIDDELSRLLHGQVGVFPYARCSADRLGEDYPFYYNSGNSDEAFAVASWVVDHIGDARGMITDVVDKIRSNHFVDHVAGGVVGKIADIVHSHSGEYGGTRERSIDVIGGVAERMGDSFPLDVFLDVMEEHLTWLKPFGRKGALKDFGSVRHNMITLYDIRSMLGDLGWVDLCNSSNIVLERRNKDGKK